MPHERPDEAYVWDMLDASRAIMEFVRHRTFEEYLRDRMLRGAVERHNEIIGEAARRVSTAFQQAHADVPWRAIIGQRHVLAHDYGDVKHDRIWRVAAIHVPELVALLEPLVTEPVDAPQSESIADQDPSSSAPSD